MTSAYLFDLDGTLYANNAAIPGARELIRDLRARNVPFRLVTNTTSRSRAMVVDRMRGYGFEVAAEEVFTATLAGAEVAREAGHRVLAPFLPMPALADLAGFELIGTADGADMRVPDAILVGDLAEGWKYEVMQRAFEYLMGGAELIALSRDRYWLRDGRLALDVGPFVAGLEYATGRSARVAGKPSAAFFAAAVRSLGMEGREREILMVGDDLWADVQGAQQAGLQGWLVRTGKFRDAMLAGSGVEPDRVLDGVADML